MYEKTIATAAQCKIASASPRAWFLFAMNSEVLTERQRNRILAGIGYR